MDSDVVREFAQLVDAFRADADAELEVRIGKHVSGSFVPGIDSGILEQLDQMLRRSEYLDSTPWSEEHVFHFTDTDGLDKRTVVRFCDATLADPLCETVCKTRNQTVDVPCGSHTIRFALSKETPSAASSRAVAVHRMAIRQRTTHLIKRNGEPYMQYDLTRRWVGRNKTEAETRQRGGDPPICELEIELLRSRKDSLHLAQSVLMKARDLVSKIEADQAPEVWC